MRICSCFLIVSLFLLPVCNSRADQPCILTTVSGSEAGRLELVKGHVSFGFEHSAFKACGNQQWWWFGTKDPELYKSLREASLKSQAYEKSFYITGQACLSEKGSYGHMGGYERIVDLIRVDQQKKATEHDCEQIE